MEVETAVNSKKKQQTFGEANKCKLGQLLQSSRMEYDLSIEEASAELYIHKKHLIALENEDFDNLPHYVFAKGFTVKYAEFLQLNKTQVADIFDDVYPDELKQEKIDKTYHDTPSMATIIRDKDRKAKINPIFFIVSFILSVLVLGVISMVSSAKEKQKQPTVIEGDRIEQSDGLSESEQRQGAYLETKKIGATGSAIHLSKEDKAVRPRRDLQQQRDLTLPVREELE